MTQLIKIVNSFKVLIFNKKQRDIEDKVYQMGKKNLNKVRKNQILKDKKFKPLIPSGAIFC